MLLHLYSHYANIRSGKTGKKIDEERSLPNGHSRVPNPMVDRQAQDAQEFELEGLMSDDEDDTGAKKHGSANGRPH